MWLGIAVVSLLSSTDLSTRAFADTEQKLVISRLGHGDGDLAISYVLEKIYARIGYQISFADYQGRESLEKANAGVTDGENMRRPGLSPDYPNLIQLSAPHVDLRFRIYTNHDDDFLPTVESWKEKRVGIEKGVLISEELTQGLNPYYFNSVRELFEQLNAGNVDVIIATDLIGGIEVLKNFPNRKIRTHGPALKVVSLFHYVHKRHADLVPLLNKEIKYLRESGELGKLYVDAFNMIRKHPGEGG
ncbi:substrate-binding periplasmic protein [Kiloniella sp.]|uniref:substrate-binding periplasmic protein n=1 Tax=Kiloniella sp. TaxID=1938587 RepID=UPI003A942F80